MKSDTLNNTIKDKTDNTQSLPETEFCGICGEELFEHEKYYCEDCSDNAHRKMENY